MSNTFPNTTLSNHEWDMRFLRVALQVGSWCKLDGNGALLVHSSRRQLSIGYTGFPRGYEDRPDRLESDETRRQFAVHAEVNAVLQAPFDTQDSVLYCSNRPCLECAKVIVQARIKRVVYAIPKQESGYWRQSQEQAFTLFQECRVDVIGLCHPDLDDPEAIR